VPIGIAFRDRVSIHAPVKGATSFSLRPVVASSFNSRTHEGRDELGYWIAGCGFNSRAHEGAMLATAQTGRVFVFQFMRL